jgi:hypothetical protein
VGIGYSYDCFGGLVSIYDKNLLFGIFFPPLVRQSIARKILDDNNNSNNINHKQATKTQQL